MLVSLDSYAVKHRRLAGVHHGFVAENDDPERLGAVRVRVPGVIDGASDALPWAHPLFDPGGGSATSQSFRVPVKGARVAVLFDEGDPYVIWYIGSPVAEPSRNSELAGEDGYPEIYGSVDEQGTRIIVDRKAREATVAHVSGALVRINDAGDVALVAPGSLSLTSEGDVRISGKDIDIGARDDLRLSSSTGDLDLTAGSDMTVVAAGGATISAAEDMSIVGARQCDVTGGLRLNLGASLNVNVKSFLAVAVTAGASLTMTAAGSASVTAGGSGSFAAGGNLALAGGGRASLTGGGRLSLTGGGRTSLTGGGAVTIRGSRIKLN